MIEIVERRLHMSEQQTQRINIDVSTTTWRNIGSLAAQQGRTKKEIITEALDFYYHYETLEKPNSNKK
jgi:hypothetical protein